MKKLLFLFFISFSYFIKAQQTLQWAEALSGNSIGTSITTDLTGNIYNSGYFSGTVDFDPGAGIYNVTAIGSNDFYLTKLDVNGNLIWVKTFGGIGASASANSVKIDASGNCYITGNYGGTVDFDPSAIVYNQTAIGGLDIFILKLDASGNFIWAKTIGSTNLEITNSLALDAASNPVITGFFYNTVDFNPNAGVTNLTAVGQKDIFILKLSAVGNFLWAKSIGGIYDDSGSDIHVDVFGDVVTTGYYGDVVDFDPSAGVYFLPNSPSSNYSAYVSKLDASGNFVMAAAFLATSGFLDGTSVITDAVGNIYTTGVFDGVADFDPGPGTYNLNSNGSNDVYVSKLDAVGNFIWAKNFGGTAIDVGRYLTLDKQDNVCITGNFNGIADFDPSLSSTYTLTSAGADDAFICKLDNNGNFLCAGGMGGVSSDIALAITVDVNNSILIAGNYQSIADFDPSAAVFNLIPVGTNETFIAKYKQIIVATPISTSLCVGSALTFTAGSGNTFSCSPAYGLSSTSGTLISASPSVTTTYSIVEIGKCLTTSTLITITSKSKPTFTPPASPQQLKCVPDSVILQASSSNTNTTIKWRKSASSTYTSQPFAAKSYGTFYPVVTDITNGCADSSAIVITNFQIPPNAKITSHTYLNALTPLDTITCYKPIINITGASDTASVNISWKSIATNSVYTNPISLTSQNNLKLIVKRNDNGCSDSSLIVLINQNTTLPTVITNTTNSQLNCSIYTASLSSIFSPTTCSALWIGPLSYTASNPATTSIAGKYKIQVTDPDNGCVKKDSINVTQTNQLLLKLSNDTTVCKQSPASLLVSSVGTLSGVTYLWNTNQTTNAITVNPILTTNYIVTANGPGGCVGKDTVKVIVPSDIQDSIVTYRDCSNNLTGSIILFAKGGIPPYKYSINNGATFFSSNSFTNIAFGNYPAVIKDSIGCTMSVNVALNANSNLPVPLFLASTKNYVSDTIVLVDISIPKPDSVQWLLPPIANIIGGTMFSPVVAFSDTGTYVVTMRGFYGSCIINATKLIRFAPYDSLQANYINANGIKTFNLYPNPNNGAFTVYIEFYKKQNASIQAWDVSPYKHFQQNFYDVLTITLPINLSQLQNGSYLLRVIGEFDAKNKPFIISK